MAAANLADRYISDRHLPDKAIDLIDEAGSRLRIKRMQTPPDFKELENRIAQVQQQKKDAVEAQRFEEAGRLRDQEKALLDEKARKETEIKSTGVDLFDEVDEEAIAEVLSIWTGIPVYKLTEEETAKLLRMEDELHKRVIGQDDAIRAVSQAIRRTRAGLKDPKRPSGSFIFLGPSGVGKTELAKTLAEFLFGDDDSLIALDMSEYMEKHTVSRLVGSPPGYVGYEEGGQLTEAVRRKPFSVVLFDEIEKAHPDVFNTLLQILEEGRLTDSQGRSVDFRNTVLIMTSNLGTQDLRKANVGFTKADEAVTLRADEGEGQRRPEAALPARVPEPHRRRDRLPRAVPGRGHPDRRPHGAPGPQPAGGPGPRPRAHPGRQAAPGRAGLRPHPRRPAAAPGHPAPGRGPAVGAASSTRSSGPARSSWSTPSPTPTSPARSGSCSVRWRASSRRRWSWPRPGRRTDPFGSRSAGAGEHWRGRPAGRSRRVPAPNRCLGFASDSLRSDVMPIAVDTPPHCGGTAPVASAG